MTTRRGSQYSILADGAGLRGRIDPSKGKRKGKIPGGTEFTQGRALTQRQVLEMPIISEPELELSMSNLNRYKSHSEGSKRHLHVPVQAVLHKVKDKDWEMLPQIHQGVMNSWHILKKVLKEEEIVRYSNGCNPLSSKPQIKKINEYHAKKRAETKEEASIASTRKPQSNPLPQEGKKNKKKNWRNSYSPSHIIPKIQNDSMDNVFNMARTLIEFMDKEKQRMRQPHAPKKWLCLQRF
ncbi:hypothetical protein O181_100801 [Austropuccinia psidii MF-1]|uniref:Uncharacterized protein n=1 Tax=Austropuccinia psidii MF-1 TaxID=1389203 RepID=A0A9Q3JFG7_9BASI|nr:hypothetical protein [Austropuccinia psidii MF-1]